MNVVELINKIQSTLNKLINKNDLSVETTELLNELLETLKVLENCKDKKIDGIDIDKFHKSINKIESRLAELEEAEEKEKDIIIKRLNDELSWINIRLHEKILCEGCKEKEILIAGSLSTCVVQRAVRYFSLRAAPVIYRFRRRAATAAASIATRRLDGCSLRKLDNLLGSA